jgi:LuxR family quorum-sensing system transcriptional regulator CciR
MSQFGDISKFVHDANRVSRLPELQALLDDITRELGFDYFALAHHVSLYTSPEGTVFLSTFPAGWRKLRTERRYYVDDPVLTACEKTAVGFCWSEAGDLIELTPRHRLIFSLAKAEGVSDGFTVPIHVPGDFSGSCSFGVRTGVELPRASFPAAQYIGCFAFEAARRITRNAAPVSAGEAAPHLTERQYDCVLLAARGLSERQTAAMLDVKPDTVHKHLEEAKRRYGASCKTQLVVKVLFNSHISFNEIMHAVR